MKELSIKEKTKRYDGFPELKENEDEDEKIRKSLLEYLHTLPNHYAHSGVCAPEWIAWLEKQGDNLVKNGYTNNKDFIKYADKYSHEIWHKLMDNFKNIKDYHIGCNDVSDIVLNAIIDTCNWLEKQNEPVEINPTEFDTKLQTLIGKFDSLPKEELIASLSFWLNVVQNDGTYKSDKKQGEQKPVPKFKIGDTMRTLQEAKDGLTDGMPVVVSINNEYYHCTNELIAIKDQDEYEYPPMNKKHDVCDSYDEQKPDDKVEPKFHEGEWIVQSHNILKIKCIGDTYYCYETVGGYVDDMLVSEIDSQFHLWTIQDAKDGDVLCYKNEISLYKHDIKNCTKQEATFGGFVYYCCYDGKRFIMDSLYSLTEQDKIDVHPATKEQRDQFEKAMADAGYTFNFEKKELKKIEQKPAWSEEEERYIRQLESMVKERWALAEKAQDEEVIKNMSNLAFFLKTLNPNKKPSDKEMKTLLRTEYEKGRADAIAEIQNRWSEEDENILGDIIEDVMTLHRGQIPQRQSTTSVTVEAE